MSQLRSNRVAGVNVQRGILNGIHRWVSAVTLEGGNTNEALGELICCQQKWLDNTRVRQTASLKRKG